MRRQHRKAFLGLVAFTPGLAAVFFIMQRLDLRSAVFYFSPIIG